MKRVINYIKNQVAIVKVGWFIQKTQTELDILRLAEYLLEYYNVKDIKVIELGLLESVGLKAGGVYVPDIKTIYINPNVYLFDDNVNTEIKILLTILHEIKHVMQVEGGTFRPEDYTIDLNENMNKEDYAEMENEKDANDFAFKEFTKHITQLKNHRNYA